MQFATTHTTATTAPRKRSAPLDPQAADRLLDLLSTDDAFRTLFRRDARQALMQVGFVNESDLPSPHDCFWEIRTLASKPAIAAARDEVRFMLLAGLTQTAPRLDAGQSARQRRK